MNVLITGISGFAGRHFAEFVEKESCDWFGSVSSKAKYPNDALIAQSDNILECELSDGLAVRAMIDQSRPDIIFHLAAQTEEKIARSDPEATYATNVLGALHIFEAVREMKLDPTILVCGSSAEFGIVAREDNPVRETTPLRPVSFYGASKAAQNMLAHQYHLTHGLKIIQAIAFNYFGPGQRSQFVCSAFAKQVAEIEKGIIPPEVSVGNLAPLRDFSDVRDVVKAYWMLAMKGQPGESYNICSGKPVAIQDLLDKLIELSTAQIEIKQDPARMKPIDVPYQVGDNSRLVKEIGWKPEFLLEDSLRATLDYWRSNV